MSLKEYKTKRNFRRTSEPAGTARKSLPGKEPFFVVQKHDATRLHYDFRLAMEGVLKSWAVPKGFPTRKGDRRLAVRMEDHPMDYARFEGTIPEGNYGAGTVMVWDLGAYTTDSDDPVQALKRGKLHLTLKGKKLKGEWTLVRMRRSENDDKPQWLLLKSASDMPEIPPRADDRSVLTGRSMEQVARDHDAEWKSDRAAGARRSSPVSRNVEPSSHAVPETPLNLRRLPKRKPAFIEPMKASLVSDLPRGDDWIYEIKFDGVRALAIKRGRTIELVSRNEKDFTRRFPAVAQALEGIPAREVVLDGEIAALDSEGRASFQLLQSANVPGASAPPIFYYVFDLIQLDGNDLTGLPLLQRKAMARSLIARLPDTIRFSDGIRADSERVFKEMKARGLEGLIAKRRQSKYEIGRRSGAWVKFKWTNEQEFVIGGYTEPKGARSHFGAVLVGYYQSGKLLFAAKVGTGFDDRLLKSLHERFQEIIQADCPFSNLPEKPGAGGRGGLTLRQMRRCTWLQPRLVCQVRFAEWTRDGHLRQPAFLGLRLDKRSEEVVRETAA